MLNFAARVDIGPKETNDDRILVSNQILDMNSAKGEIEFPSLVAVCDGCGGYKGGGIAAQTVLEELVSKNISELEDKEFLAQTFIHCEQSIEYKKRELPQFSEMCTTIAGCLFSKNSITIFHAGDSRVYRFDGTYLAKMTLDHSVVQDMVNMGRLTEEEAKRNESRNIITRCLGIDGLPPEIYVTRSGIKPGDIYILCTDGLWESVSDEEITNILSSDLTLEQMTNALVNKALEQGCYDNVSVCICASKENIVKKESKPFILD